jgi:aminopeptidase N
MLPAILLLQVAASAPPPPATHDALAYDITLVPADTGTHILGEVQTTWRLRSGGAVTALLDSSMRVVRVLVDGKPNTRLSRTMYGRSGVDVVVPHEKPAGDTLSTRIRYHGLARGGVVPGPTRAGPRGAAGGGSPVTARLWLPVPDDPDDRASVRWSIQAPIADRALASGTLERVDTLPYGHATWHYRLDQPAPIGRYAVAVGPYITVLHANAGCEGCPVTEVWSYRPDSAVAAAAFRRAGDMVAYLSRLLGRFPYERLVHVEAAIPDDAVSSAEMALYREDAFAHSGPSEALIARETARQWLGIAVSPDSAPARRLFEGLPRYLAAMWRATTGGPALAEAMRAAADSALAAGPEGDAWHGAWTLHELRGVAGDSAFTAGLRALVAERRDSTASVADVARVMSQAAGVDVGWVLRQAEGAVPVVEWRVERRGGGHRLRLTTAGSDTLRMPGLRLLVDGKRVRADFEGAEATVRLTGFRRSPSKVELDPAGTWLVRLRHVE